MWLNASPARCLGSSSGNADGGDIDGLRHVQGGNNVFQNCPRKIRATEISLLEVTSSKIAILERKYDTPQHIKSKLQ